MPKEANKKSIELANWIIETVKNSSVKKREGKMVNLSCLGLSDAQLNELLLKIEEPLTKVKTLYLSENNLTTIPLSIFIKFPFLEEFYVNNNQITKVLPEIPIFLKNISSWDLRDNALEPKEFDNFCKLAHKMAVNSLVGEEMADRYLEVRRENRAREELIARERVSFTKYQLQKIRRVREEKIAIEAIPGIIPEIESRPSPDFTPSAVNAVMDVRSRKKNCTVM